MSLLTSGVVQGMVGASLHMKSANVAMGIYHQEKAKGAKANQSILESSSGLARDSMNSAAESNKQAQEALREAQKEARKQAQAEQEAAIEERRQEAAKDKKQEEKEKIKDAQQNAQKSAKGKKNQETDVKETNKISASSQEEIDVDYDSTDKKDTVIQGIYTAQGEVKPASVGHKVVVTV
ncbi:hypothetical protein GM661_10960 [Iocasia frigidifontis]|uniref:Uncharacterized protein n=1 Tax=Iocasia fonsfrigidae TaxID=2682810 RepID=A0A8A7KAG8_9FIRM|nr:hypothetical protein [Iocasia fonsfrigidae]QTL98451.1 hypothetical protein GM661_10960 [Iocasia fonsfrigidae]